MNVKHLIIKKPHFLKARHNLFSFSFRLIQICENVLGIYFIALQPASPSSSIFSEGRRSERGILEEEVRDTTTVMNNRVDESRE